MASHLVVFKVSHYGQLTGRRTGVETMLLPQPMQGLLVVTALAMGLRNACAACHTLWCIRLRCSWIALPLGCHWAQRMHLFRIRSSSCGTLTAPSQSCCLAACRSSGSSAGHGRSCRAASNFKQRPREMCLTRPDQSWNWPPQYVSTLRHVTCSITKDSKRLRSHLLCRMSSSDMLHQGHV